ncbi:MAG TPA: flagellar hook basal-body protein [Acidobacteriaceae bacterium]|jgi:flagellar basal-body rod protein FlgF/flagellar basal-body rod protein FlgG|nr:flagellar hook basal-body protein [Acidobacteriaceae bacterium]
MDSGYYAAFSGWLARSQALDVAAGNLANAGTAGYRAERDYFRSTILGPDALGSQLNTTVNAFGVLGGTQLDMGQGALTPTGNPLDLAVEGGGFFAIQTPQGVRYTRDGQFQRAQDGTLTDPTGDPVLDARGQAIRTPAGNIAVGEDGAVSVNGALAGRIALVTFASPASLSAEGANRYAAVNGAKPAPATGTIRQGALEASNQDVIEGSLQLVLMQRQAEMMQKAVSMFNNDLDKTASEDLPRVD